MTIQSGRPAVFLPTPRFSNSSLEAIKWLAVALMTADHINKYLFNESSAITFAAGRMVMPLFAVVLAFNLARPAALERGVHLRVMAKLAIFGAVATAPFVALGGLVAGWYPLNILWMLFVATSAIYMLDRGRVNPNKKVAWTCSASATIALGGAFVEFWWPGVCLVVFTWCYLQRPTVWFAAAWILSLAALAIINGNHWAAAAVLPLIAARLASKVAIPRAGMFFYAYYPAHLIALLAVKTLYF